MVNELLIQSLGIAEDEAHSMLMDAYGAEVADGELDSLIKETAMDVSSDDILIGRVVGFAGDDVVIDVGLKSEGLIPKNEFDDASSIEMGMEVNVIVEDIEGEGGLVEVHGLDLRIAAQVDEGPSVDGGILHS